MKPVQMQRTISASSSAVVAALELQHPKVATRELLDDIVLEVGAEFSVDDLANRLVRTGWLLPLRTRNSWEFAPGARAGGFRSEDPWIELRAVMLRLANAPVAVAFDSAAWQLGFNQRQPSQPVFVYKKGWRPPESLSDYRKFTFEWSLPLIHNDGLPVLHLASQLVAAAEKPRAHGDWANAGDWLPEMFRAVALGDVLKELRKRSAATKARLGFMAEWSARNDIADRVESLLDSAPPVTSFGPRENRENWVKRWHLYNGLLEPK